jgi:hypothetical protein
VLIDGEVCQPTAPPTYASTEVRCVLPAGTGAGYDLTITVDSQTSNAVNFDYDPPAITSIDEQGQGTDGGYAVTLTGDNFGASGTVLVVGGEECVAVEPPQYSNTEIVCLLPAGVGVVTMTVTVDSQTSEPEAYTYGAPTVSSWSPQTGPTAGGTWITFQGTNFGALGDEAVTIGGAVCDFSVDNSVHTSTTMKCLLPQGEGGAR